MAISAFLVATVDHLIQSCLGGYTDFEHANDNRRKSIKSNNQHPEESDELIQRDQPALETSLSSEARNDGTSHVTKLIIGLSLHSILTGVSIGMASTTKDLLAGITAILPHKIPVIILLSSLLLEVKSGSRLAHIICFSSALPLGILLSGVVNNNIDSPWLLICLEAIGSGAVFYVSTFEMLPEALTGQRKLLKYAFCIGGILIISVLQLFHSD